MIRSAFHALFAGAMLLQSASCTSDGGNGAADTAESTTPARSPESAAATTTPATSAGPWTAELTGLGPVRVGMSSVDLQAATPDLTIRPDAEACQYVRSDRWPSGVLVMLARGHVARIDVDSSGVRTTEGIGVGDSASRIPEVYGARAAETPHKYVTDGKYYTVAGPSPADSVHRIVFETENGRVARFRVGRVPEVEWVERCG